MNRDTTSQLVEAQSTGLYENKLNDYIRFLWPYKAQSL